MNLLSDLFSAVCLRHQSRDVILVIESTGIKLRCSLWPKDTNSKSSELDRI